MFTISSILLYRGLLYQVSGVPRLFSKITHPKGWLQHQKYVGIKKYVGSIKQFVGSIIIPGYFFVAKIVSVASKYLSAASKNMLPASKNLLAASKYLSAA